MIVGICPNSPNCCLTPLFCHRLDAFLHLRLNASLR